MNFCVWPARLRVCTCRRSSRERYRWRGVDGRCGDSGGDKEAMIEGNDQEDALLRLGQKNTVFNTKIRRFWYNTAE
jgi:hypothetical protein